MRAEKMRLMVLTHGSLKAIVIIERLLALECAEVVAVFVETETSKSYTLKEKIKRSIRYDGVFGTIKKYSKKFLPPLRKTAVKNLKPSRSSYERLRDLATDSGFLAHFVSNFHLPESLELMRQTEADLGVVLGTNILKESVFSIPRLGCINTHQGLAPFYRGGPPVFWELFNDETEVGLTVHFVAAKVDTGEIIIQETLPLIYDYRYGLNYEPFIESFREKLSDRAAELVPRAVQLLADGKAILTPQNIALGKRYRLPVKKEKDELRRRLRARLRQQSSAIQENAEVSNQ
ncbi:MAG: formyltransferase family protein [Acidobacteriota bacterium]